MIVVWVKAYDAKSHMGSLWNKIGNSLKPVREPGDKYLKGIKRYTDIGWDGQLWQLDCPELWDDSFFEVCENCLSSDEKLACQQLNAGVVRQRSVFRRAALRVILGAKLACRPEEIIFACSETGRPSVEYPPSSLDFNVSHAGATSLVAVVARGRVGVDIEASRQVDDPLSIARGIFSRRELALLEAASAARQQALFLRLWTAKEAWIKMLGCGFSVDVRQYCVTTIMADDNEGRIFHLDDIPGHVAAVALDFPA